MLDRDNISIMMLKNVLMEELDKELAFVSKIANMEVKYLSAMVVPENSTSLAGVIPDFYLKVVGYGINSLNEPVSNADLKR